MAAVPTVPGPELVAPIMVITVMVPGPDTAMVAAVCLSVHALTTCHRGGGDRGTMVMVVTATPHDQ